MYLVVGATGPIGLGGEICKLLRAAGKRTRALVRHTADADRVANLSALGVDIVEGDLKDPRSLEAACLDVHAVISTASMLVSQQPDDTVERVDDRGQCDLIDAAKSCGVKSLVYISFSGRIHREFPFKNAKRKVEQHLQASGLAYTILRPTFYMEVWLAPVGGFDYQNASAAIYGEGQNKISWLSFYDVARFALVCLDDVRARNAIFELGGPEALSPIEAVRIFEEISGRPFEIRFVPREHLSEQLAVGGNSWVRSIAGLRRCYADGDVVDMREFTRQFPMTLTSVREHAIRVMGPGRRPVARA